MDPSVNNLIILNYLRYAYQVTPTILNMIMVTTKQKFDLHDQYINQPEIGSEIHTTTTWYAIASLTILTNDKCLKLYWYPIFYMLLLNSDDQWYKLDNSFIDLNGIELE